MIKKIQKIFFSFLLIPSCFAATSPAETLATQLEKIKTFSAHFEQTVSDEKGRLLQETTGEMQFIRPSQFHWQTMSPSQQTICYDNQQIISYDPELEQAIIKKSLSNNDPSLLPLMLLTGDARQALKNFSVSEENQRYVLKPKLMNDDAILVKVELFLDKSGAAQEIRYTTRLNQATTILFKQEHVNQKLFLKPCLTLLSENTDIIYDA